MQPLLVQVSQMKGFSWSDVAIYSSQLEPALNQRPSREGHEWLSAEQYQEAPHYEFQSLSTATEQYQFYQLPDQQVLQQGSYEQTADVWPLAKEEARRMQRQTGRVYLQWQQQQDRELSNIYVAIADYQAADPGTVDLKAGQRVQVSLVLQLYNWLTDMVSCGSLQVLDFSQGHWWKLRLLDPVGVEGYAPSNYLTRWSVPEYPLPPTSQPPPSPLREFEVDAALSPVLRSAMLRLLLVLLAVIVAILSCASETSLLRFLPTQTDEAFMKLRS